MKKVTIIGAGNVGSTAAMKIAQYNFVEDIVLLDVKEGYAEGKAMDIMQCASAEQIYTNIIGVTNDYSKTENSDVIIITSGIPRKPGMTREELVGVNSKIMKDVVTQCHKYSPDAIYIVVSNPMDTMTYYVQKILINLSKEHVNKKVFGMGGLLDSSRFKYNIKKALKEIGETNIIDSDIEAWVIGGHGDATMIPLIDSAIYNGEKITNIFSEEVCNKIVEDTMKGGATLTGLLGTSAWEAPGACIAKTVLEIENNIGNELPCSVYRLKYDLCIGTLVSLNNGGISQIIINVDEDNKDSDIYKKMNNSAEAIRKVNNSLPKE